MRKSIQLIRFIIVGVLVFFTGLRTSEAQVTVSMPVLAGSPGDTVVLPVTLANVEATGTFNSFQFKVVSTSTNIVFLGHDAVGTLSGSIGWVVLSNTTTTMNVGGFASNTAAIGSSGVLVNLSFRIDAIAGGSIQLEDFRLSLVATRLPHTPAVPQTGFSTSNRPVATDDTYFIDEGGTLTIGSTTGVLANDTDADGDQLTAILVTDVSNGTLSLGSNGSFTYIHDGSETTFDSFTYAASDGVASDEATVTITINPVNDAPTFTTVMSDVEIEEGSVVTGSFVASDADGDVLTYALVQGPSGAQINSSTGAFTWASTSGSAGTHTVVVSVTDGAVTVESSAVTIIVLQLERFATVLSGLNALVPNSSAGTGSLLVEYLADSEELRLSGSFSGLASTYASAQFYVGGLTEAGVAVLTLSGTIDPSGTSGTFSVALNTFDLSTVVFPAGMTQAGFVNSLEADETFMSVLTIGTLTGEIRGQLLPTTNSSPLSSAITGPSSVNVAGDPTNVLYSLGWSSVSDSDGGTVRSILVAASDASLSNVVAAEEVSSLLSVDKTVADGAALYDQITGGSPGSIALGGAATVYYAIVVTDGAALSSGTVLPISLVRGQVTDTEEDEVLPESFVLRGNFPNPFNPTTSIQFDLPEVAEVEITVLDLLGRTMLVVPYQTFSAGLNHTVRIDATDLTSGIYIYRVVARSVTETQVATGTMTLIK